MSKKRIIISLVTVGVLLMGVIIGLVLVRQRQNLKSKAAPATTLELEGPTLPAKVGEKFIVYVNIDTAENLVAGVELSVEYDPAKLTAEKVNPGSFFANADAVGPFIDSVLGTVYYTLLTSPGTEPKQGSGTIASIEFRATGAGSTIISFDRDATIVVALQEGGQNVLTTAASATINVVAVAATSTPAPTDSSGDEDGLGGASLDTPTPTPTPTPTATPDPIDEDEDEAYPTDTPTPFPTSTSDPDDTEYTTSSITPTNPPDIPVTGLSWPTVMAIGLGFILILGSLYMFFIYY